ncbi:MAG: aldehyde dehydrogenase family protein [Burkholderiaceae bacterium]
MKTYDRLYIDGQWVAAHGTGTIDADHAATEEAITRIPEGDQADVDAAVAAARAAFDGWSATPAAERADALRRISAELGKRADDIAMAIATEVGMPLKMARRVQTDGPVANWAAYAKVTEGFEFEKRVGSSLVIREAIGVVGCITPWNFPLNQITLKVAPAIGAGCTVVLKPSEVAPTVAFILAGAIAAAGLPKGVFNLVTGYGPVVGEALAKHGDVDMISFTGSTRAGRRVGEVASQTIKRVSLELGGKSASVILDDADLASAIKGTIGNCFLNSGQACIAQTRMLVPAARFDEAKAIAKQVAETFTVGDPLGDGVKLGPLVSAAQRDRVTGLIDKAVAEGAELVTGGSDSPFEKGYFVRPTVFATTDSKSTIAQEEVFGPVLTILPYADENEAVKIANDSPYGLGGGVWGEEEHAIRVARRIRTGQIDINGGPYNPRAPFGGYKQSGNGRESGVYGFEEFLEYKSLQLKPAPKPSAPEAAAIPG